MLDVEKEDLQVTRTYKVTESVDKEVKKRVASEFLESGKKISESDVACTALKIGLGLI